MLLAVTVQFKVFISWFILSGWPLRLWVEPQEGASSSPNQGAEVSPEGRDKLGGLVGHHVQGETVKTKTCSSSSPTVSLAPGSLLSEMK